MQLPNQIQIMQVHVKLLSHVWFIIARHVSIAEKACSGLHTADDTPVDTLLMHDTNAVAPML